MAKEPKKAKRKIKDLEPDASTGKNVKGGQAQIPNRDGIYRKLNDAFRPKS